MGFLEKCVSCGQFIGYENYVCHTPYGHSGQIDPPDPEFECLTCWDNQEEEWRELTYKISWIKPIVVRNGKREPYIPKED